jgi:hypothetical protein
MNRLASTPQRAVDRLDGIARGAHYDEWNRGLLCQDASIVNLEKVACGAFSDNAFVAAGKKCGFCQLPRSRTV